MLVEASLITLAIIIFAILSPHIVKFFYKKPNNDLVHAKLSDGYVVFTTPEAEAWAQKNPKLVKAILKDRAYQFDRV